MLLVIPAVATAVLATAILELLRRTAGTFRDGDTFVLRVRAAPRLTAGRFTKTA